MFFESLAGMVVFPIAAQGEVEGRHGATESGDGEPYGQHDLFEVCSDRACEVDAYGNDACRGGERLPLCGTAAVVGQGCFDFSGKGCFPDAAHTVKHQYVAPGTLDVFRIETRGRYLLEMLCQSVHNGLPLVLPVGEGLGSGQACVVRPEHRAKISNHSASPWPWWITTHCGIRGAGKQL